MSNNKVKKLNKFTTLPVLLDLLERKKLTLLDPALWDDRNDAEIISAYKEHKKIESLMAVCFSYGDETIHHWKTFSSGTSGCVIEFNAERLFEQIDSIEGLKHDKVEYRKLSDIEDKNTIIDIDRLPFTKRWPYRCEEEYRIIIELDAKATFYEIPIELDTINRITISQQMPRPIYNTIKSHLKEVWKNPDKRISHSTLYENKRWINHFKNKH